MAYQLPAPLIPNAMNALTAARQGYAVGSDIRNNALMQSAGKLAASGNMKGAANELMQGGQIAQGMQILDKIKADSRAAKAEHLKAAAKENEILGNMALSVKQLPAEQQPEAWAKIVNQAKSAGVNVKGYEDPASIDFVISMSGKVNDVLKAELDRRKAGGEKPFKDTDYGVLDQRTGEITPYPKGSGGAKLTKGEEAVDKNYADQYAKDATGGLADMDKNISQLEQVKATLESKDGPNVTGTVVGNLPDVVGTVITPTAVDTREQIEEVIQRNLREVLGAQFTEKEGERLISRAFNPRLSEATNAKRVDRLLKAMKAARQARGEAADYFRENGTLKGFKGKIGVSMADLEKAIDEDGGPPIPKSNLEKMSDKELLRAIGGM